LRTAEKVTSEAEKSEMRRTVKEAIEFVLHFIHRFALSLWSGLKRHEVPLVLPSRFFCESLVTMFSRFRKTAPAPTSAASGSNRNTMNSAQAKLSKALNNIAYHHVEKYANAIKVSAKANAAAVKAVNTAAANPTPTSVKNATLATANAVTAQENVNETEKNAKAATALTAGVPAANGNTPPAAFAALNAEAVAANAVARNAAALANFNARIAAANKRNTLTNIEVNIQKYANSHNIPYNRNNVKQRINAVKTKRNSIRAAPQN